MVNTSFFFLHVTSWKVFSNFESSPLPSPEEREWAVSKQTQSDTIMSFILQNAFMNQEADPEKIKLALVQFDAMSKTFNTMLRTCRNKCIPGEYDEADLNKGETVCIDRCVAKYYSANIRIGEYVQTQGLSPDKMAAYDRYK